MPRYLPKHWIIAPPITPDSDENLARFSPIMRQILFNRGYKTHEAARSYLRALPPDEVEPEKMLGVREAVERIKKSIIQREAIAVYGDYDADGVTATALLTEVLQRLGAPARGYIPNRFDEGYGLNFEALDSLAEEGVKLVVTVDCGVRSLEEADYARRIGMDMVITDHHHPSDQLPHAVAVIDPKQPGDTYPDKNLAGVGLAFKLASALLEEAGIQPPSSEYPSPAIDYLDLVAIGTVADQAPLIGENRSLVRTGIEYIRNPHRQGILSLIGAAQIDLASINSESIGYSLGPRLNAAGRLDSALAALNLLLTRDVGEAARLAQKLDLQNRERQEITRAIQSHAEEMILAEKPDSLLLFAADDTYNPGVIGLAAARLMEKYYRPTIVAFKGEELTRGSCRSIPEFHITHALDQCADLLERHGGHAAAAGFTVRNSYLDELITRLKQITKDELQNLDLRPSVTIDSEVSLSELSPDLLQELAFIEPTGNKNPPAIFASRGVRVLRSRQVGKDGSHLKLAVTDGRITYDAIAFRLGELNSDLPLLVDIVFSFELNRFNGNEILQLNVKDIQPSNGQINSFS
jgi:single-stranded-DNA-specific exonuclease